MGLRGGFGALASRPAPLPSRCDRRAKGIYKMVSELKESDTSVQKIKLPASTTLRGMSRPDQIKEVEDYVFLVKAYSKQ